MAAAEALDAASGAVDLQERLKASRQKPQRRDFALDTNVEQIFPHTTLPISHEKVGGESGAEGGSLVVFFQPLVFIVDSRESWAVDLSLMRLYRKSIRPSYLAPPPLSLCSSALSHRETRRELFGG